MEHTGLLRTIKILLHDTIIMDTHQHTLVQTHRMYNMESEPQCKLWTLGD